MNNASNFERYEQLGLRFLVALDRGDLDALDSLWAGAESDPELETMFCALSCAFDEDAAETSIEIMIEPGSDSAQRQPSLPHVRVGRAAAQEWSLDPDASTPSHGQTKG
jgi:hypothetical protein